jgi:hypothetical protein
MSIISKIIEKYNLKIASFTATNREEETIGFIQKLLKAMPELEDCKMINHNGVWADAMPLLPNSCQGLVSSRFVGDNISS